MRWLVRFGYDGSGFAGWARQPGRITVEGEIRRGLRGFGLDLQGLDLEVASRTDRGVSARANALALHAELPGPILLRTLNGVSPELFFTGAREITDEFRVRAAARRTYRYFEGTSVRDAERRQEAAALFHGEIDVRSLGRGVPSGRPIWRIVESVVERPVPGGSEIEVQAPSFVWGMVRKIVAALREVDAGRLSIPRLRSALEGKVRLTLPMAEPEPLILWEVEYLEPWKYTWNGPNRAQVAGAQERRNEMWVRERLQESLLP